MSERPLTIGEARRKADVHSRRQEEAEQFRVQAARDLAEAERQYRLALAQKITAAHADGTAWTACQDIARGDGKVADLRYARDVKRGVLDAAAEAAYRHAADRRALETLVRWSMGLALGRLPEGEPEQPVIYGGKRAA